MTDGMGTSKRALPAVEEEVTTESESKRLCTAKRAFETAETHCLDIVRALEKEKAAMAEKIEEQKKQIEQLTQKVVEYEKAKPAMRRFRNMKLPWEGSLEIPQKAVAPNEHRLTLWRLSFQQKLSSAKELGADEAKIKNFLVDLKNMLGTYLSPLQDQIVFNILCNYCLWYFVPNQSHQEVQRAKDALATKDSRIKELENDLRSLRTSNTAETQRLSAILEKKQQLEKELRQIKSERNQEKEKISTVEERVKEAMRAVRAITRVEDLHTKLEEGADGDT